MDLLPIKSIHETDAPLVGVNLLNLSVLARLGLPIADGVVVFPPEFKLKTILEYFDLKKREVFEQRLTLIKDEVRKIPVPGELEVLLKQKKIKVIETWHSLLEVWLNEIRARVWNEGFSPKLTANLKAHPIFFTNPIIASGEASFTQGEQDSQIKITTGALSPVELNLIDGFVKKGDQALFLPQTYFWIKDGKSLSSIKIVKIQSVGEELAKEDKTPFVSPQVAPKKSRTSAINVLLNLEDSLSLDDSIQGILIEAKATAGGVEASFEKQVFQLIEAGQGLPGNRVIFKLSDQVDRFGGIRGTLRLLHQESLLKSEASAFLFARNKKGLLNLELAIPLTHCVDEFLALKRELASLGITRKGSLKLWLEVAVVENVINIKDYLNAGLDGVIFNFDELTAWLNGFDPSDVDNISTQTPHLGSRQVASLRLFLKDALKVLHQERVPLIALSNNLSDDLLEFLVEVGFWGVVVKKVNLPSIHEHLGFLEKRLIRKCVL